MESRRRWLAVALAFVGGICFAFAVQKAWWSIGEAAIGPFGTRACFANECRETGLSWIGGSELWMRSAVAARAAGYIAMFVLLALAGALAARRIPHLVARASIVAILTAGVTGAYFFFAAPTIPDARVGLGVFLLVGGVVLGFAAALFVMRSNADVRRRD